MDESLDFITQVTFKGTQKTFQENACWLRGLPHMTSTVGGGRRVPKKQRKQNQLICDIDKVASYRHMHRHKPKEPCHFVSLSGSEIHYVSGFFPIRYSIRVAQQDSAFKITEVKSVNIWLRYDPKHLGSILGHISAKY